MFYATNDIPTHDEPWRSLFQIGLESLAYSLCGDYLNDATDEEVDEVNSDFDFDVFSRLTRQQKIALMVQVGRALLEKDATSPPKTAAVDATFCSILYALDVALDVEIDYERFRPRDEKPDRRLRQSLRAIHKDINTEVEARDRRKLPRLDSLNRRRWRGLIEDLLELLPEDYDFELEHLFVDDPPVASAKLKQAMQINDDYFEAAAPEPGDRELPTLVAELSKLTEMEIKLENARR